MKPSKKNQKKIKAKKEPHEFCGNPACLQCFEHTSSHGITKRQ